MFYCQLMSLLRKISSFETMFLDSLCVWSFSVFSLLSLKWFFCPLSLTGTDSSSPASWSHFFLPTAASVCWAFTPAASIRTETAAETTQHIYILRDWIQKKRKIVWGCLERWSCPWCWILSPGILETLVIHTACLNYTVWSQQLKNLYVRGHESSDMRNCVQGHEI